MELQRIQKIWECPLDEEMKSICSFRDKAIIITNRSAYLVDYDFLSDSYWFEKIQDK
jgi:hypothetical protein